MKTNTNSILSDFDDLESSLDPIKEIKQFIKDNYKIDGELQISNEPNENGRYEVSCYDVLVKNNRITSLTNNLFEWGEISGDFDCFDCRYLTSLKGSPKKVGRNFKCDRCKSLTSLEGAPEKVVDYFCCSYCDSLTSLEGAPKETGYFDCFNCGKQFTKDDVKKKCSVRRSIFI